MSRPIAPILDQRDMTLFGIKGGEGGESRVPSVLEIAGDGFSLLTGDLQTSGYLVNVPRGRRTISLS